MILSTFLAQVDIFPLTIAMFAMYLMHLSHSAVIVQKYTVGKFMQMPQPLMQETEHSYGK